MPRISPPRRATPGITRVMIALAFALVITSRPSRIARADERAASARLTLDLRAPPPCPSAEQVVRAVDRLVGEKGSAETRPLRVTATVSRDEGGAYTLRLETPGEGSTRVRELRGPTCSAVTDAAALIIALMVDPSAAMPSSGAETPSSGASDASAEPPGGALSSPSAAAAQSSSAVAAPAPSSNGSGAASSSAGVAPSSSASAPSPPKEGALRARGAAPSKRAEAASTPISARAGFVVGVDVGSVSSIAALVGASGALYVGRQRFEFAVLGWPPRASTIAGDAAGTDGASGGDIDLIAGSLGACRDLWGGPLRLAPCASAELGRQHALGFGVAKPTSGASLWFALKAGALVVWEPWDHVGLTARLDLVVPFVRPQFVLEGLREVHRPSAAVGRLTAGVELSF